MRGKNVQFIVIVIMGHLSISKSNAVSYQSEPNSYNLVRNSLITLLPCIIRLTHKNLRLCMIYHRCIITYNRMDIACQESSFQSTSQGINNHTKRDQETRSVDVHASKCVYNSWASQQKHSSNNYIRHKAEHEKHYMSFCSPPVSIEIDINTTIAF